MRRYISTLFSFALCLIALLSPAGTAVAAGSAVTADNDATAAVNRLAADLYRLLAGNDENVCFSPYSVSTAFAMTFAGAEGDTADQMRRALHFSDDIHRSNAVLAHEIMGAPEGAGELRAANSIWPRREYVFRGAFRKILEESYATEVYPQDFAKDPESARLAVNNWVEEKTAQKIRDLLAPGSVREDTALVLVNAVYFNASWLNPFQEADTSPERFAAPGGARETPTMKKTETLSYYEGASFHAIRMPYRRGVFSMTILLPYEGRSLGDLESELSYDLFRAIEGASQKRSVEVWLPKFKAESLFSLNDAMRALGIEDAFMPGKADFSGMNGARDLFISEAVHKAFIEVEEKGTEAAAATAIGMRATAAPLFDAEEPLPFHADRPFVYLVSDEISGAILFMGKVVNP
jgi:serpin B